MSNPYIDAVAEEPTGASNTNPYLAAVPDVEKPDPVVTGVRLSALEKNPEQAIAARRLGRQYGLPLDVAEAVLPDLKKRAASEQADSVLQRSPKLSRFIGADPSRGVAMVDDLPVFGEIERTLGTFPGRRRGPVLNFRPESEEARRTRDRFDRALTAAQGSARATDEASLADPAYLGSRVAYGYQRTAKPAVTMALNDLTGLYEGDDFGLALRLADQQRGAEGYNILTPPKSVTEGAQRIGEADGVVGSLGAVLGSPAFVLDVVLQSIGSSSPSLVAAVAGGTIGQAGAALGAGGGSLAVEYTATLLQEMQESGRSVTSAADVFSALRDPLFMDKARQKALTRGVAIGAFDALTAGLAGSVIRNTRGASRAALAAAVGGEAALQAAGGAGGELLAQALTESKIKWAEVWLEGIAEIASGAVEVPSNLAAARRAAEARFAAQDHGAMVAERNAAMVKELSAAVTASKTLARDPQTLQEFIDTVALDGGRVEDIFVDARTFAQTVGEEKLAELRQASPALAAQMDEALAMGGDLVIPLGEFVTTIGQSDVMPSVLEHIRADAADMSVADAKVFMQGRDEQMLAEAEKALEQAGVDSELARSSATVEQSVLAELTTAARFTPAVNERYAKLVSAFFTTMAQRTGMTPEAFAERYKLRVRNEAAEGRTLTAVPVTETPEFKNWFGDSYARVRPTSSKQKFSDQPPQRMVHTTRNAGFDTFEPGRVTTNSTTFGDVETTRSAVFFTPDTEASNAYASGAGSASMPVYLRALNPLVLTEGLSEADEVALLAAGLPDGFIRNVVGRWWMFDGEDGAGFVEALRRAGFDSVVLNDENPETGDSFEAWAVFEPTQIKSIFNRGTFDPTAASILAQPVTQQTTLDDFKPGNLPRLLSREDWAIVTAHNPMGNQLSPEENAARNERLAEELQRRGIDYSDSIGKYVNDAEVDPPEDGFILFGITHEQAHEIGNLFEQDSVLINRGLLYHDNTLNPADGTMVEHAEAPDNYFTRVPATEGLFTLGIDFSQRVPYVREFAQPADRGRVDNVAVVHYSKEPRTSLASWFYGRGMKGAEYDRVMASDDLRLRERVHFYVSAGQPIVPETDVGTVAHTTTVGNLYDADLDHLKLRRASKNDANAFESAILDAGYDGYLSRSVFGRQGAVVMLGRRSVDVKRAEGVVRPDLPPAPRFTENEILAREIASHKALPSGAGSLDWWAGYLPKVVPDLAAKIPAEAWARMRDAYGKADVYRSDLAKLFEAPEVTRSFAQSAYHGTPHKFDRFTLDAIGSGEGVQAFGWGLYFTSKRDIAEWYRRKLTDDTPVMNWKIGPKWVIRDEAFIDYSPRDVNSSADQAWSASAEALLIHERDIKDAFNSGGLTAARAEMLRIMDETIEIESGADARPQFLWHLGRIRTQVSENLQFDMGANLGQLYEANIPDPDVMLHWDRPLSDQPEAVRAALAQAGIAAGQTLKSTTDFGAEIAYSTDILVGEGLYAYLQNREKSAKAASEYLNSLGIKGISFPAEGGKSDARNFVVFDDSAIEVLNTFYQEQTANRGQIAFGEDITRTPSVISLFEQANLSTFLHESGHFFLEVMSDMASRPDAPADVAADVQKLMKWFGLPDIEAWRQMSPDQQRPHHERFARAFEAYLFEGKAPTQGLAAVFGAFRSWLVAVYRSITGLNVELNDEIRGVMDRMLATEQQIAEENDRRVYAPLFATAEEMGATAAEWAAYQRAHGDATEDAVADMQARSLRDMRWLSGAKSREITRLQKEAKDARAAVEAEARAEVRNEPVYAAMRWLKFGEMVDANGEQVQALAGFKLDIEAVRVILAADGRDVREMGFGKYGMVGKEGLDPQIVADMFGFTNGETLVHSILNATPEAEAVEALTDQRMLERYGELVDDKAIDRAADAAVHNEARGKFVATELRALAKALNKRERTPAGGSVNLLAKAAKDLARQLIARKRIGQIKPNQFSAAEVRAARAAQAALVSNDLVAAVTEKRNQLVNFYATREAQAALGRFEMGLRKMKKALASESIDQDYLDQIAGLLDRYSLRPLTQKESARRKSLVQWVESQKAAGYEPVIDEDILNEARRVPIREITMEEFDGLVAAIENIAHLGRLKKKLLTAKDARDFAARVAEAEQTIRDNATRSIPEALEKTRYARFKSGVKEFFVMHVKFANTIFQMDGWKDGGPLWELFVRPMNEAGDREAVMREQATIRLSEMFKKIAKGSQTKVFVPEINAALSAEARMVVALNTGNEGNLQRLMDGDGWTMDQVQAIVNTLTKEQMDFVQEVWDMIDEYRPMIGAQQKRITGVEPEWIEATPVTTPHGTYRGGYFPAKYDTDRSTRSLSDEAAAGIMDQWRAARGSPKTRDSFTKGRAAKVTQRPLRKDFGVVTQHVTEVAHRLAWQDYLIDANRLLAAKPIDAAIREHYGPEVLAGLRDAIKDIAAGEVGAQNAFESSINHLRVGTTIVGLGWNLVTGLLQPIGLTQSMVRIGPKWVAKGLAQWLGDAVKMENTVAAVYAKSDFMRLRGKTMQREISEIRNIVSGKDSRLEASYFFFIQRLQVVADMPTWLGMYAKAIESMNASEETAVALADQAVLDAQSGGQVKDLSAIQRGGPLLKLFTNFYSFFNTTFNLTRTAFGRTNFRSPVEGGLFAVDMLLLYTIPAVLGTLMKAALQGDMDDEDELARKLVADQMNYLLGTMVGLREIGGATTAALGLPSGYSGPAGVRFFGELQRLAKQVEQGEADSAFFKAMNNSAGILFHYPAGQINRTIEGATALLNGETDSPAALIVGPPK